MDVHSVMSSIKHSGRGSSTVGVDHGGVSIYIYISLYIYNTYTYLYIYMYIYHYMSYYVLVLWFPQ